MIGAFNDMTDAERKILDEQLRHLCTVAKRALAVDRVLLLSDDYVGTTYMQPMDALRLLLKATVRMGCQALGGAGAMGQELPTLLLEEMVKHLREAHGLVGELKVVSTALSTTEPPLVAPKGEVH